MNITDFKHLIFAHRGASLFAPENTMASFALAIKQGAKAIELDTKLSADQVPVVIHDPTVDRTTDGKGKVADLTLQELKRLNAGSSFDESFSHEKIPTLEEVLTNFGDKVIINIELTNYAAPFDSLPEIVANLIKKLAIPHTSLIISSFNPRALIKFHKILPDIFIGLLSLPGMPGFWVKTPLASTIPANAIHPHQSSVTKKTIDYFHRKDKKVFSYTVNDEKTMKQFFSWGIDGIFTDDPPKALGILEEINQ